MNGRRVLVSGMGGQLGSLVASLLEAQPWVGDLAGIDADPPRRRLTRARFCRIDPSDREQVVERMIEFDPHVVVHLAMWEPDARAPTATAVRLTAAASTAVLGAAGECRSLERIVVRSGIEVYGRGRGAPTRPTERAATAPTSSFGRSLAALEADATAAGAAAGVPVASLRLAPVVGPHVPSPLGRLLRLPAVPFSALADPAFTMLLESDAAQALVLAAGGDGDGPLNVVGPGATTALAAIRRGRRLPLPLIGPEWWLARRFAYLTGTPIPDHVVEALHRGRLADGSACAEVLGWAPQASATEIVDRLYAWPSVQRQAPRVAWEVA
jgi:UDP-glucose 4-epimerase